MKKTVALISENQEIGDICARISERNQFFRKKIKDVENQVKKIHEETTKLNDSDWDLLRNWLKDNGRLPEDYADQTYSIGFNLDSNAIHISKNKDEVKSNGGLSLGTFNVEDLPPNFRNAFIDFVENHLKPE